jgi:stage V sporulation protein B
MIVEIAIPICMSSIAFSVSGIIDARTAKVGLEQAVAAAPLFFENLVADVAHVNNIPNLLWGGLGLVFPIYNFLPSLMVSFGVSLLPNLAAAWVASDKEKVKRFLESSLRMTSLFAFSAGAIVFTSARSILFLVYSTRIKEMSLIVPSLRILGICIIFSSLASSINVMLQAIGRVKLPTVLMIIGVTIKYFVNKKLVVVPEINIKGAAIGSLTCFLFIAVVGFFFVAKLTQVKLNIKTVFIRPALIGLGTMVVGGISNQFCLAGSTVRNIFAIVVPMCSFCLFALFFGGLEEGDLLMLPFGKKLVTFLAKVKRLCTMPF